MSEPAMSDVMSAEEAALERRAKRTTLAILMALIVAAAAAVVLALSFVHHEKERDLLQWQIRLGIVADSRAADVGHWVDGRFDVLRGLAQNTSVQLYVTNLSLGDASGDADAVEGKYLRNLLYAIAMREGFMPQPQNQVEANLSPVADAGIAILDARGRTLAATAEIPNVLPDLQSAIQQAAQGRPGLMDLRTGPAGRPVIGFAVPIYAVQASSDGAKMIGSVVAVQPVGDDLFARLRQPGDTSPDAETLLVRASSGQVEYLSPLGDGTGPLKRRLADSTPQLAAAFVVAHPGGFAELRDYAGRAVLATGRVVPGTPWFVVRKIASDVALAGSNARLTGILVVSLALIAAVVAGALALWFHGSSIRVSRMALRHKVASELFEGLLQFLRTLADNQPSHIICCDADDSITFANKTFANAYGVAVTALKGKRLADVMGPARATPIREINHRVLTSGEPESHVERFEDGGVAAIYATQHVTIPATPRQPPGVMTVVTDITELTRARDRSEARLEQLVSALVGLVDRRDPFSAHHSARTAEVAGCVAKEMGCDAQTVATVRFAGQLMNLGKIVVPQEILVKPGVLTDDERRQLAQSFSLSADIIAGISFDGPVADTIRQMGEHWDGTGPLHLAGEAILLPARIVAVANAFVAMVSPRAYRDALSMDLACQTLKDKENVVFDRRPVSALVNIVANRDEARQWASFGRSPNP